MKVNESTPRQRKAPFVTLLASWASAATILAAWLWWTRPEPVGPLENLPDDGLKPGGKIVAPNEMLSSRTRLEFGQTARMGNIEVTPQSIEWRTAKSFIEGSDEEPIETDKVLVLTLEVRNVSTNQIFAPLDPAFLYGDDKVRLKGLDIFDGRGFTYTFIHPRDRVEDVVVSHDLAWREGWRFKGQDFPELKPNESAKLLVISDAGARERVTGSSIWRVKLRKGLTGSGLGIMTVIGVEFTPEQIRGS